jgi:acetyl esterase/lipase
MSGRGIDRRTLIAAASVAAIARPGFAAALPSGIVRRPIWPGAVPGGTGVRVVEQEIPRSPTGPADDTAFVHVTRPTLAMIAPSRANGAAILLVPGGGYRRVAVGIGTYAIARHFASAGFHAFVLVYRLPADGWAAGPDAPLQDAQRAMRLIAAEAPEHGYDPRRIGALGFSAGGHLAARLGNEWARDTYAPVDAVDRAPVMRPRATGLLYPVVSVSGATAHGGSREELVGKTPDATRAASLDANRAVGAATPPTWIAAAIDDAVVPVDNSLAMFAALRGAKVPTELHLFERGNHGFGLEVEGTSSPWPDLFIAFARRHGLL